MTRASSTQTEHRTAEEMLALIRFCYLGCRALHQSPQDSLRQAELAATGASWAFRPFSSGRAAIEEFIEDCQKMCRALQGGLQS